LLRLGRTDEVVEWDTDHSPFLTRPSDIADLLAKHPLYPEIDVA
jgi:hypothetical protein